MKRLLYKFTVLSSSGLPSRSFTQDFESPEQAEAFRKTEEASLGFKVQAQFLHEVKRQDKTEGNFVTNDESLTTNSQLTSVQEVEEPEDEEPEDDVSTFPRGWHRRNQFVSKSGNVYVKGELAPELFGTLPSDEY